MVSPIRPTEPPPPPPQKGQVRILHTSPFFSSNSLKKLKVSKSVDNPTIPRATRIKERSKSFTKSLSQIPKSFSYNSLDRRIKKNKSQIVEENSEIRSQKKDMRKILSSPVIGSPEMGRKSEHIYEEIPETIRNRPLPPVPGQKSVVKIESNPKRHSKSVVSIDAKKKYSTGSSVVSIEIPESPVKSIFEGATKYDILHYLEDAKERGFTDCELEYDEDEDEHNNLVDRNHANRVSSTSSSNSSQGSGSGRIRNKQFDIERNDSGLGSETGKALKRPPVRVRGELLGARKSVQNICEDCDQVISEVGIEQDR